MAERKCNEYQTENPCRDAGCGWDDEKKSCRNDRGSATPFFILMTIAALLLIFRKTCSPFIKFDFQLPKSGEITIWGPDGFFYKQKHFGIVTISVSQVGKYTYRIDANGYKSVTGKVAVPCGGVTLNLILQIQKP